MPPVDKPGLPKFYTNKTSSEKKKSDGKSSTVTNSFKNRVSTRLSTIKPSTSFGIYAQRSKGSVGIMGIPRGYENSEISMLRHSLTDNRAGWGFVSQYNQGHNCENSSSNKFQNTMMAMGMLNQMMPQLGDLVSDIGSMKSTQKPASTPTAKGVDKMIGGGAVVTAKSTTGASASSITAMRGAKDSVSLREAIESAKAQKVILTNEVNDMNIPNNIEAQVAEKEKAVAAKEKEVNKAYKDMEDAKKQASSAQITMQHMEKAVGVAATNYSNATVALENAKLITGEAKFKLDDANVAKISADNALNAVNSNDPNYAALKIAYDEAIKNYDMADYEYGQALKAEEEANKAQSKAQAELNKAKTNNENAVDSYTQMVKAYEARMKEYMQTEQEHAKVQKELETEQVNLNELRGQLSKKNELAELTASITEQEKRLAELQKQENEDLESVDAKMQKLNKKINKRKINTANGTSWFEKRRGTKNVKDSAEYSRLSVRQAELQKLANYNKLYKQIPVTQGGINFRTHQYDGETLYMVGAKKVTKEEYDKAWEAAGGGLLAEIKNPGPIKLDYGQ